MLATLVPRPLPQTARAWEQRALTPDARARALVAAMTADEKFRLIRSDFGLGVDGGPRPEGALGSAGYTPAIARLGIPALQLADAGLGVTNPANIRPGDYATPMPSGPMTASTWSPEIAWAGGATMGRQAWRKGFNVLLAGSLNLQRDPRNGRNFEYAGEDPLLAGTLVGASVRGIQDQHVVSTLKHFAMNDMETGRNTHSADIGARAMHESDLLAFRVAMEVEEPGAVMSAYNRINGTYAGEHAELLDRVLKRDWGFGGWVLSDWGGAHSAAQAANAGLDQQSAGEVFDKEVWFDRPLREAIAAGTVAPARLDDMATRVLRGLIATGAFDHPPRIAPIDVAADEAVVQRTAEAGIVLLHNPDGLLPLAKDVRRVLVVGGHADRGVIAGGGSSAVLGRGGNAVEGIAPTTWPGPVVFHPSSPLAALRALLPQAEVRFVDGRDLRDASRAAGEVDAVVVFATQWSAESVDLPDMDLPQGQDALIAAVAEANPRTAVVLETNGPVPMPWREDVGAVLEAWYPGIRGGEAIARVLLGEVNPSGRLPVTWPTGLEQLPRPALPGLGFDPPQPPGDAIDYTIEGANVGYRWFAARGLEPLYPFGHGLSYTTFAYDDFRVRVLGPEVWAYFSVANTGARRGADVPQLYLELPAGHPTPVRLAGWQRIELDPGERREVAVRLSPHALADYDPDARRWHIPGGRYGVRLARSAGDAGEVRRIELPPRTLEMRIGSAPTAAP
ncbi:glycoside hydrolase family 3 C-terminal domain-containing protein [Coralloluteibacterium stylophorae]|uniref:glycoside hydrolase family 3 C-terminal domain-containing protein n=1 Tax=Coralloluteibacterium stylophorae TaxID=1776034 RepID=UPI001FE65280|nr:glycoside hydrolase family 3 C-terminal domain-containing protein [Coralloluteibacterium stylophorae]